MVRAGRREFKTPLAYRFDHIWKEKSTRGITVCIFHRKMSCSGCLRSYRNVSVLQKVIINANCKTHFDFCPVPWILLVMAYSIFPDCPASILCLFYGEVCIRIGERAWEAAYPIYISSQVETVLAGFISYGNAKWIGVVWGETSWFMKWRQVPWGEGWAEGPWGVGKVLWKEHIS